MGFFDKAKEFAGKKVQEFQANEKKKAEIRSAENRAYNEAYQKARVDFLKEKARKDARAQILPSRHVSTKGLHQKSVLMNVGANAASNPFGELDKRMSKALR